MMPCSIGKGAWGTCAATFWAINSKSACSQAAFHRVYQRTLPKKPLFLTLQEGPPIAAPAYMCHLHRASKSPLWKMVLRLKKMAGPACKTELCSFFPLLLFLVQNRHTKMLSGIFSGPFFKFENTLLYSGSTPLLCISSPHKAKLSVKLVTCEIYWTFTFYCLYVSGWIGLLI